MLPCPRRVLALTAPPSWGIVEDANASEEPMKPFLFHLFAGLVWLAVFVAVVFGWPSLVSAATIADSEHPAMIVAVLLVLAVLLGVVIHSRLADLVVPPPGPPSRRSDEELRAAAHQSAQAALRDGQFERALEIYEGAGLLIEAADIAQRLGDTVALLRLSLRLGFYDRARRLCLDLGDLEGAAQASTLMGEIRAAHDLYREAAEKRVAEGAAPREIAPLFDRAGRRRLAAQYYEEAGDLERAAECYDLLGDKPNAVRCADHARAFRAYEKRRGLSDRETEEYRADMARSAALHEAIGDFLSAGFMHREAGQMMDAAIAFEKCGEWERAARAYASSGLEDRAALARTHVQPGDEEPPEAAAGASGADGVPAAAPAPSAAAAPSVFRPVMAQAMFVPVFAPPSMPNSARALAAQERMAQRIRRGEYTEAAEYAVAACDWLMAAALFERGGDLLRAADLYRQVGKHNDAAWCLEKVERPCEAALLAAAAGNSALAIDILGRASGRRHDPALTHMQADLLLRRGEADEALELFRSRFGAGDATPDNAVWFHRMARLAEEYGHPRVAHQLYRALLRGGAQNVAVSDREATLAAQLGQPAWQPGAVIDGERVMPPMRPFPFDPPDAYHSADVVAELPEALRPPDGSMAGAGRELSLFGEPADRDARGGDGGDATATETAMPRPSRSSGGGDPFVRPRRYEILREVGRGGMGIVYEALDTALDRHVALKLIQAGAAACEDVRQFLLEARAVARLSHPNIVTLFDIGFLDMKHYITMEMVSGGSLEDVVGRDGRMPFGEALRVFAEVARGLRVAHEAGVVHRDIKPGNVLLGARGEVKIVDFGLAQLRGAAHGADAAPVRAGSGTPGYMAPEQIDGAEPLPSADIYALGVTLFFMLAGRAPHKVAGVAGNHAILTFQLRGQLPSLKQVRPDTPDYVEQLFRYCTDADPARRYQSVDAFLPAAEQWAAALRPPAAPVAAMAAAS